MKIPFHKLVVVLQGITFLGIGLYAEAGIADNLTVAAKKCVAKYGLDGAYMSLDGSCHPMKKLPPDSAHHNLISPGYKGKPQRYPGEDGSKPLSKAETKALKQIFKTAKQIIGPKDDRLLISNTTTIPARQVAYMTYRFVNQTTTYKCTAWLYGKDIVATASHCLYDYKTKSRIDPATVRIMPGYNSLLAKPDVYNTCKVKGLLTSPSTPSDSNVFVPLGYALTNGYPAFDYGAIKLNCTIGNTVGWFQIWHPADTVDLTGQQTTVNGYSFDKNGQQWYSIGKVLNNVHGRIAGFPDTGEIELFDFTNDVREGDSGAPLFQKRPTGSTGCVGYCVIGLVSNYAESNPGYNVAKRMTNHVFNFMTNVNQ